MSDAVKQVTVLFGMSAIPLSGIALVFEFIRVHGLNIKSWKALDFMIMDSEKVAH
jgi:hypothetical protein